MKTVRITLELPNAFIAKLRAHVTLAKYLDKGDNITPAGVLSLLVLGEAMGQPEAEIDMVVPPGWRDCTPEVIHAERRVYVDGTLQSPCSEARCPASSD